MLYSLQWVCISEKSYSVTATIRRVIFPQFNWSLPPQAHILIRVYNLLHDIQSPRDSTPNLRPAKAHSPVDQQVGLQAPDYALGSFSFPLCTIITPQTPCPSLLIIAAPCDFAYALWSLPTLSSVTQIIHSLHSRVSPVLGIEFIILQKCVSTHKITLTCIFSSGGKISLWMSEEVTMKKKDIFM